MPCCTLQILRQDTTANWASIDPVLAAGEFALDTTTGFVYVGDGVTPWSGLTPLGTGGGDPGSPTLTVRTVYGSKLTQNFVNVLSDTVGNESSYLANNVSPAQGDFVEWDFSVPAGDYILQTSYHAFTNRGIADVEVDGNLVGTINMHAAVLQDGVRSVINVGALTAGIHALRYTMATAGAGGGFIGALEAFGLVRQP